MFDSLTPFKWIADLFTRLRLGKIRSFLPAALPIAEAISGMDWDGDGAVETRANAEQYVLRYLHTLGSSSIEGWLRENIFNELFDPDSKVSELVVRAMTSRNLKRLVAVVMFVRKIYSSTGTFPRTLTAGLIETIIQLAYESTKKS